jgi:thiol-disulfide isomerase/thioredoxin
MKWAWAAALAMLIAASPLSRAAEDDIQMPDRVRLGEFVPAFSPSPAPAISLTDTAGNPVALSDFRGKLVILNLWATWCEPCLREMPSLERLQSHFGDRAAVLAVSEDRGGAKIVEPFIAKLGLKEVKIYLDPKSEVGHAFDVHGLPTSLVIDPDGKLRGRVAGAAEWDSPKMLGVLEPLLPGRDVVKTSSH